MRTRSTGGRWSIAVLIAALTMSLLPLAASAQPRPVDDPADACPRSDNPPAPFTDRSAIPRAHVRNVDCASNYRITLGYEDGSFRPRDTVRRDQFASFLVRTMRAADVNLPEPEDQGFTDVRGNTHEDNINILAATGITTGVTATRYRPGGLLRRDQVASFVLRAVAYIEDVPLENLQRDDGPFTDVPSSSVHAPNINGARVLNLTVGKTATTYEPRIGTTRAQMASFLIRLLAALSSDTPIVPDALRVTTLDLRPATSSGASGTVHTLTATARDRDGDPVQGAPVRLEVYRDDAGTAGTRYAGPREVRSGSTGSDGRLVATYTGPQFTADDVIVACVLDPERTDCQVAAPFTTTSPDVGARVDDTADRTWIDRVTAVVVDDEDLDAINPHGTSHTVDVTAEDDDGAPVAGAAVRFEVYRDDASTGGGVSTGPVTAANATTDQDGRAAFTYVGPDTDADDHIVICRPVRGSCLVADEDAGTPGTQFTGTPSVGATPFGTALKRWRVDPFELVETLGLDPQDASNHVATSHTVTATAADADGAPVEGSDVRFEVYRDEASLPAVVGRGRTGGDGGADFTYDGPEYVADDVIVACPLRRSETPASDVAFCVDRDDRPVAEAVKRWRFQADAGSARAAAVLGEGTGDLVQQLLVAIGAAPEVEVATDGDPRQVQEDDALLVIPANPLLRVGATEVDAAVDLDEGRAVGDAQVADVELLGPLGDLAAPLLEADVIRGQATAACPTAEPFDSTAALEAASEGSGVVGLAVAGTPTAVPSGVNQELAVPGLLTLTFRQVEAAQDGETITYTVRGLVVEVEVLDLRLVFAESEASIDCTD